MNFFLTNLFVLAYIPFHGRTKIKINKNKKKKTLIWGLVSFVPPRIKDFVLPDPVPGYLFIELAEMAKKKLTACEGSAENLANLLLKINKALNKGSLPESLSTLSKQKRLFPCNCPCQCPVTHLLVGMLEKSNLKGLQQ